MYLELLSEVEAAQAQYGLKPQPPCGPEQLARLEERVRRELHADLPAEYARFLLRANGLNWNGLFIYASEKTPIVASPSNYIEGFVEMNQLYRDNEWFNSLLVFGDGNMDLYVQDLSSGEFKVIDRVPGNLIETFPSFDQLLASALEAHL